MVNERSLNSGCFSTGVRSIIATAKLATEKRLSVVAGTQRRHQASYLETMKRIQDGELGELTGGQCYWNGDGIWFREKTDWLAGLSDFEWQCWNWYHWDWLSGDQIVEQHIHNIDVMNWAFGGPPVKFYGMGGRQNRGSIPGNIWDHFAVEMDYANGARVSSFCRHAPKTSTRIGERVVGTKGVAIPNNATITGEKPFKYAGPNVDPMVQEHADLIASIRANAPVNEAERVAESTLTAIGARIAAERGMTMIPPYDHPHVMAGQGTAAKELIDEVGPLDWLYVPCGGGGLTSGSALAAKALSPNCKVVGVEPEAVETELLQPVADVG